MPYPINQSWREQIELNWIGARVGLWDTALKFLSPGPRNDVTDHLEGGWGLFLESPDNQPARKLLLLFTWKIEVSIVFLLMW